MAQNVVVVVSDDLAPYQTPVPAFVETMGGQPRIIQLQGREAIAEAELGSLRSNPPDVVLALGAKAAFATRFRLPSTPLVYTSVLDPGRYGIAGPQVTGIGARVEPVTYLSQVAAFFPSLKTVGVIRSVEASPDTLSQLVSAGEAVGLKVVVRQVDSPREFRREMHQLAAETDAVWVSAERGILTPEGFRGAVQELRRRGKPLLADTVNMVGAGAAFAVVPDPGGARSSGRRDGGAHRPGRGAIGHRARSATRADHGGQSADPRRGPHPPRSPDARFRAAHLRVVTVAGTAAGRSACQRCGARSAGEAPCCGRCSRTARSPGP